MNTYTTIAELIKLFDSNKKPSDQDFEKFIRSYWHKSEKLPIEQIEGLWNLISQIKAASGDVHLTIANAMAVDPLPANNEPFVVVADESEPAGQYIYDSMQPNGWKRIYKFLFSTNNIDDVDTSKVIELSLLINIKELLDQQISNSQTTADNAKTTAETAQATAYDNKLNKLSSSEIFSDIQSIQVDVSLLDEGFWDTAGVLGTLENFYAINQQVSTVGVTRFAFEGIEDSLASGSYGRYLNTNDVIVSVSSTDYSVVNGVWVLTLPADIKAVMLNFPKASITSISDFKMYQGNEIIKNSKIKNNLIDLSEKTAVELSDDGKKIVPLAILVAALTSYVKSSDLYSVQKSIPLDSVLVPDGFWGTNGTLGENENYDGFDKTFDVLANKKLTVIGLKDILPSGNYGRLLNSEGGILQTLNQDNYTSTDYGQMLTIPNVEGASKIALHFLSSALSGSIEDVKIYDGEVINPESKVDSELIDFSKNTTSGASEVDKNKFTDLKTVEEVVSAFPDRSEIYSVLRTPDNGYKLIDDGFWDSSGSLDSHNSFSALEDVLTLASNNSLSIKGLIVDLPDGNYGRIIKTNGDVTNLDKSIYTYNVKGYHVLNITVDLTGVVNIVLNFPDTALDVSYDEVKFYDGTDVKTANDEKVKKDKLPLIDIIAQSKDDDKGKAATLGQVEEIVATTKVDTSSLVLADKLFAAIQNYPLDVSILATSFWGTDLVLDTDNASFVAADKAMESITGDTFLITGLVSTLPSGSYGRLITSENTFSASLGSANFTDGLGGKILTIPTASNGVASVLLNFPLAAIDGDISNVKIYRGTQIIPAESQTINSDLINPSDRISSVAITGVNYSTIWLPKYYFNGSGLPKGHDSFTALATKVPLSDGENVIFGDIEFSANANNFRFFNENDDFIGSMGSDDLSDIDGGKGLTVVMPNAAYMYMYTGTGMVGSTPKIYKAKSFREINQISDEALTGKLTLQKVLSKKYFEKGKFGNKINTGTNFLAAVLSQSHLHGRSDIAELPSWFTDAGNVLLGAKFCDDLSGNFADYSSANFYTKDDDTMYGWDLDLAKLIIEHLGQDAYFLKNALGGTSIEPGGEGGGNWSPDFDAITKIDSNTRHLSSELRDAWINSKTIAEQQNPIPFTRPNVLLIVQGEGDRHYAGKYLENFLDVVTYFRGVFDAPELPVIVFGVSPTSLQYNYDVEASKKNAAALDKNIHVVDAPVGLEHFKSDIIHYNGFGGAECALRVFNKMIEIGVI